MKFNKKKFLIACSIVIVAALLLNLGLLYFDLNFFGGDVVTRIYASGINTVTLKLDYLPTTGRYRVENIPEDEDELMGDGAVPYDGSLGKYRIAIKFGDTEPSTAIRCKLAISKVLCLYPVKLNAKIVHPSDHGFLLYIGSDTPISVTPVEYGELNRKGGTVSVPITIG